MHLYIQIRTHSLTKTPDIYFRLKSPEKTFVKLWYLKCRPASTISQLMPAKEMKIHYEYRMRTLFCSLSPITNICIHVSDFKSKHSPFIGVNRFKVPPRRCIFSKSTHKHIYAYMINILTFSWNSLSQLKIWTQTLFSLI